ncbi:25372_t:CDS:2, partial [Racocetra persica]
IINMHVQSLLDSLTKLDSSNIIKSESSNSTHKDNNNAKESADGIFHKEGLGGVNQDNNIAFQYFEASTNLDNKVAMCHLARCYKEGICTSMDPDRAFIWYLKAAEHGDKDGMRNVMRCYEGIETLTDPNRASYW